MIERVFNFGSNNELSGILTMPDAISVKKHVPSLVFLNAGFLHKTGFNRFNTDFARHLSHIGYSSLRFDLHGLGDSATFNRSTDYDNQVIQDIKDSIDYITSKSDTKDCILIGLCSGADYAHLVATIDQRISGLILLDGYSYPTLGFYIRDYGPGLFKPLRAFRYIFNKFIKLFKSTKTSPNVADKNIAIYLRSFPKKKQIINDLQSLIDRGLNLLYIYSGGIPIYYNYSNQFYHMFRSINFKGRVTHHFIKEADHTYTIIKTRQKLSELITDWITKNYP